MPCLGSALYDPGTLATASTASLLAMTALDTTNLRITFQAPSNGAVLVRIRVPSKGAATVPQLLFGVLDGATVRARQATFTWGKGGGGATLYAHEICALVTGLTAGQSYTWDAAYGVEFAVAATQLGWGGPNNTTTNDAYGAAAFEIWDTPGLLAGTNYDPASAVSAATSSLLAMTALDTTNLRLTFTCPSSGRVYARLRTMESGATTTPTFYLGVLDGATVRGRVAPIAGLSNPQAAISVATDFNVVESLMVISGLTPGQSYTWDAAYGVEAVVAATNIKYGGPNDATQDNAYGGFTYEIWAA